MHQVTGPNTTDLEMCFDFQLNGLRFGTLFLMALISLPMHGAGSQRTACSRSTIAWVLLWSGLGVATSLLHYVSVVYLSLGKVISLMR